MLGASVLLLNVGAVAACAAAAAAWWRSARLAPADSPNAADEPQALLVQLHALAARAADQSRLNARAAVWTLLALLFQGLSIAAVLAAAIAL